MQRPTDKESKQRPESLASAVPTGASVYMITVTPDGQAHVSPTAAATITSEDTIALPELGRRTRANLTAGSGATVLWSPADSGEYTLIVDGAATLDDKGGLVTPKRAVLHRPGKPAPTSSNNSACGNDCMGVPLRS